mgnify:CR=1 FL=1
MKDPWAAEDSDRIHCVMHGKSPEMARNTPKVSRIEVVKFLHPVLAEDRARTGFGLPEVIVAVTVFGAGVLGVAAVGGAAFRVRARSRRSTDSAESRPLRSAGEVGICGQCTSTRLCS